MALLALAAVVSTIPSVAFAKKKEKPAAPVASEKPKKSILELLDTSKVAWPPPPDVARIKYLDYFANQKWQPMAQKAAPKKSSWMSRMAGGETKEAVQERPSIFALANPYGMAEDHKGNIYIADGKVSAIFIFNTETKDLSLIETNPACRFGYIVGLAIDDDDTLYVSDSDLNRVDIFDASHKFVGAIKEGMVGPGGLALDSENRLLYVVNTQMDQVLVFDADSHKLLRHIGTTGQKHKLTSPGDFAMPTNAAVDADGNLYVSDTWNDRVEEFDADGNFILTFGKNGDGPGTFQRPKGIAIDSDGHVWVADSAQDTIQIFTPDGGLLMDIGGHGLLPGQFSSLAGLYIDRNNRVFTSEDYPGRVQMFRYITEADALAEYKKRAAEGNSGKPGAKPAAATPAKSDSPAGKK